MTDVPKVWPHEERVQAALGALPQRMGAVGDREMHHELHDELDRRLEREP